MSRSGIQNGDYLIHVVPATNANPGREGPREVYLIREFTTEPGQRMRWNTDKTAACDSALRSAAEAQSRVWLETGPDTGLFRLIEKESGG